MNFVVDARRLVQYVSSLEGFFGLVGPRESYQHMGATITDTVLQAGLNYRTVVEPRVKRLIREHPEAQTTTGFRELIAFHGLSNMLDWSHPEKPRRIMEMTWLFSNEGLDTEIMVRNWLEQPGNTSLLLELKGVGAKTVDYLKMLVGLPIIPVDRHVRSLVSAAGLNYDRYEDVQHVVGLAADNLGIRKDCFDRAIWFYLSGGQTVSPMTTHYVSAR